MILEKGDTVFFARILRSLDIYETIRVKCRTVEEDTIVVCDGDSISYLIDKKNFDRLFLTEKEAKTYIKEQKKLGRKTFGTESNVPKPKKEDIARKSASAIEYDKPEDSEDVVEEDIKENATETLETASDIETKVETSEQVNPEADVLEKPKTRKRQKKADQTEKGIEKEKAAKEQADKADKKQGEKIQVPRKRGRKKKEKETETEVSEDTTTLPPVNEATKQKRRKKGESEVVEKVVKEEPAKKRGRPKKTADEGVQEGSVVASPTHLEGTTDMPPKAKRGRKEKETIEEEKSTKTVKVKEPVENVKTTKNGNGKVSKAARGTKAEDISNTVEKPKRGRPKKAQEEIQDKVDNIQQKAGTKAKKTRKSKTAKDDGVASPSSSKEKVDIGGTKTKNTKAKADDIDDIVVVAEPKRKGRPKKTVEDQKKPVEQQPVSKKRGRPKKVEDVVDAAKVSEEKTKGKKTKSTTTEKDKKAVATEAKVAEKTAEKPKRTGRKSKTAILKPTEKTASKVSTAPAKKRGRPKENEEEDIPILSELMKIQAESQPTR